MIKQRFKQFISTTIKHWSSPKQLGALALVLALFMLFPKASRAADINDIGFYIVQAIGWVISLIVGLVGRLLLVVIDILVTVAQYNGFIYAPVVTQGWGIVRDLCNMFFVLILLIIAFGTILHSKSYNIKSLFTSVLFAAVLINFSKTICGIFIDVSQVVTLTFVAGFQDMAGGNFTNMLGIEPMLKLSTANLASKTTGDGLTLTSLVISYLLALVFALIALVVMVAMLMTFVIRMVYIWIYIILSPLAYLLNAIPSGKSYAKQWWSRFSKEVVVAPILAFFIWLALSTLGTYADPADPNAPGAQSANQQFSTDFRFSNIRTEPGSEITVSDTQAGSAGHILRFIVSLGMLIGGLTIAKSVGAGASSAAGSALGRINKGKGWVTSKARKAGRYAGQKAKQAGVSTAKFAGRQTVGLAKGVDRALLGGVGNKVATSLRGNVFSKDAWRGHFDKITGRTRNRQRHEATVNGFIVDKNNVRHEVAPDGVIRAVAGKYDKEVKDAKGNIIHRVGDKKYGAAFNGDESFRAMGVKERKFYEGRQDAKGISDKNVERRSAEEKSHAERMKKYDGLSNAELLSRQRGTANHDDKRAIYDVLLKNKGFPANDPGVFQDAQKLFGEKPELSKKFNEAAKDKYAAFLYGNLDPNRAQADPSKGITIEQARVNVDAQRDALSKAIKKGEVKLSTQSLEGVDPGQLMNFMEVYRGATGNERFGSDVRALEKDATPEQVNSYSEAILAAAKKHESDKYATELVKEREAQRNTFYAEEKANGKSDPDAHTNAQRRTQAAEGLIRETVQQRVMDDHDAYAMRSAATILNNDPIKSFTYKDQNNVDRVSNDQIRRWVETSSAHDKNNLDTTKEGFKDIAKAIAGAMTYNSWKAMEREGSNPQTVIDIAKKMAEFNHPEAEKLRMHINGLKIDEEASERNGLISQTISKSQGIFAQPEVEKNNLDLMNEFRKHLDNQIRTGAATKDDFYEKNKDGKLVADAVNNQTRALRKFMTTQARNAAAPPPPGTPPGTAPGGIGGSFAPRTP